jgi:hypothetical protein
MGLSHQLFLRRKKYQVNPSTTNPLARSPITMLIQSEELRTLPATLNVGEGDTDGVL